MGRTKDLEEYACLVRMLNLLAVDCRVHPIIPFSEKSLIAMSCSLLFLFVLQVDSFGKFPDSHF